jgi:hypothetical protein
MTRFLLYHTYLYEIVIAVILVNSRDVIKEDICFDLHDLNSFRARAELVERNGAKRGCVRLSDTREPYFDYF